MLYDDKRGFFRMMVNADAHLTLLDPEAGREIAGVCRDLSATGMAVEVDGPIEINDQLHVRLEASNNSVQPLDANAKVIRCTEQEDGTYILGLEIVELN